MGAQVRCLAGTENRGAGLRSPEVSGWPVPIPAGGCPGTLTHVACSDRGALGFLRCSTLPNLLSIINRGKT